MTDKRTETQTRTADDSAHSRVPEFSLPSSVAQQPDVPPYTNCDVQIQNVAPDDGLKSPKHVEHLMVNKDTL